MPLEDTRDWISSFTFAAELDDSETPAEGSFTLHILDRDLIPAKEFKSALTQEPALRCLSTLLDGNGQVLPADPRQLDEKLSGKELDDGPIVFLEQIFVSEHRRRQGVGSWMVDRMWDLDCMQEAVIDNELEKARSAANLASSADQAQFVCTCLPTPLAPELRKFFEKNGFKQIRDTPIWGAARPESKRASLHTPPSL